MPTTLSFTHTLPPQLTHYISGDLGTLSLGIPHHTCIATKVARETTIFFFQSHDAEYEGNLTTHKSKQSAAGCTQTCCKK